MCSVMGISVIGFSLSRIMHYCMIKCLTSKAYLSTHQHVFAPGFHRKCNMVNATLNVHHYPISSKSLKVVIGFILVNPQNNYLLCDGFPRSCAVPVLFLDFFSACWLRPICGIQFCIWFFYFVFEHCHHYCYCYWWQGLKLNVKLDSMKCTFRYCKNFIIAVFCDFAAWTQWRSLTNL